MELGQSVKLTTQGQKCWYDLPSTGWVYRGQVSTNTKGRTFFALKHPARSLFYETFYEDEFCFDEPHKQKAIEWV